MRQIGEIHLHHSSSNYANHDNLAYIRKIHVDENGWSDVGYHYFINRRGDINIARPIEKIPASIRGRNAHAIAICLSGNFAESGITPTARQVVNLTKLLLNLLAIFNLKPSDVYGHNELANTLCPGFNPDLIRSILWKEEKASRK